MEDIASSDQIRVAWRLSANAYHHLIHKLCSLLPKPADDTPEALAARNDAAIAEIIAMLPVNADEVALAARCVAARAQADDVLRLIRCYNSDDLKPLLRLNAQYAAMERTATAIHRQLQRTQAVRHKRDANNATAAADEWTQHIAEQRLTEALHGRPPASAVEPPAEPVTAPHAESASPHAAAPPIEAPEPAPDFAAAADQYALTYPKRAQLIRRQGEVPEGCDFGPPEPELVHAIATGTSPVLRALDTEAAA